jgi:hypothetical protein
MVLLNALAAIVVVETPLDEVAGPWLSISFSSASPPLISQIDFSPDFRLLESASHRLQYPA